AIQAWGKTKNRVEDWLPPAFPETQSLEAFFERFGSDEFLMMSWPGCTLDDPRAEALKQKLLEPADNGIRYFDQAFTGNDMLKSLASSVKGLNEQAAAARLSGLFIGPDGKQTCVIALVSQAGLDDRDAAVAWAWRAAVQSVRMPLDDIHLAGSTADSVAVDRASADGLMQLNAASMLVCFLILLVSLRSFWLVGTIFVGALLTEQLALAIIHYSGGRVDSVLLLVANLSFVLTLSAGLHYLGYFRESLRDHHASPALKALRAAVGPSILAAATTSIGFISLCTSEIVPIRRFGIYSAIVVPINTCVIVTILSIHSTWTSHRNWRLRKVEPVVHSESFGRWAEPLVRTLSVSPIGLLIAWLLFIGCVGAGVLRLTTSVGTHKLLSPGDKLILDYVWLEQNIGPLVPIEVVLRIPKQNEVGMYERLQAVQQLRREIMHVPDVKSSWSVVNLLPPIPDAGGMRNTVTRAVITKAAQNSIDKFRDMRLLFEDDREQAWRISGRVSGSGTTDYEVLLSNVNKAVDNFRSRSALGEVDIDISGGVPFVYRTQRQLMVDMLNSFSSAFLMIAVTMAVMFRSITAGLLSMIPNVTPAAVVFGIMGLAGLEVELGTVLTASVIMGVCVDDTLHLITHFRSLREKGLSPRYAVQEALANCGGAMSQTALVCGLGMLVFAASPFTPIARFAWLTFALLAVGVFSDLVLTPAILLSPLHRVFCKPPKIRPEPSTETPTTAGAVS
ncbi:MAG: MMPL family transporter, partial [Pirellulales bacterium]